MKGCFIVFEGIDGSGKTEQVNQLAKKLRNMKYDVVVTREPTRNSSIGRLIRKALYGKIEITEEALALLFASDRVNHTMKKIIPEIEKGKVVISDRYIYSSLVYQSIGKNKLINEDWIKIINPRIYETQQKVQYEKLYENIKKQELISSKYYEVFNFNKIEFYIDNKNKMYKKREYRITEIGNTKILKVNGTLTIKEIREIIGKYIKPFLIMKNVPKKTKIRITPRKLSTYLQTEPIETKIQKH